MFGTSSRFTVGNRSTVADSLSFMQDLKVQTMHQVPGIYIYVGTLQRGGCEQPEKTITSLPVLYTCKRFLGGRFFGAPSGSIMSARMASPRNLDTGGPSSRFQYSASDTVPRIQPVFN